MARMNDWRPGDFGRYCREYNRIMLIEGEANRRAEIEKLDPVIRDEVAGLVAVSVTFDGLKPMSAERLREIQESNRAKRGMK